MAALISQENSLALKSERPACFERSQIISAESVVVQERLGYDTTEKISCRRVWLTGMAIGAAPASGQVPTRPVGRAEAPPAVAPGSRIRCLPESVHPHRQALPGSGRHQRRLGAGPLGPSSRPGQLLCGLRRAVAQTGVRGLARKFATAFARQRFWWGTC